MGGTVIGSMIGCNPLSYHNVKRLFTEIMPSYEFETEYKTMSRVWKKHRSVVHSFQCTLSSLKKLVREINLGNARLQELRQHILDLHFNKNHAKRIERLVMTDNQLAQRQKKYEQIKAPTIEECK